jgi:hypothetical protein
MALKALLNIVIGYINAYRLYIELTGYYLYINYKLY